MRIVDSNLQCLIDSGSTHNFISKETLAKVGLKAAPSDCLEVTLADGSKISVAEVCQVPVQFSATLSLVVPCYVASALSN